MLFSVIYSSAFMPKCIQIVYLAAKETQELVIFKLIENKIC